MALFESVIKNQRAMKELESNLLHRLTSSQVRKMCIDDAVSNFYLFCGNCSGISGR